MKILGSTSKATAASPCSGSSTDDEVPLRQRARTTGKALVDSDLSDDSEFTEKGTEICQLGEEICAVPVELLDLPDLKSILNLDTWNFCLSEEERESLCAFLPDLDEQSFKSTLKELFAGENFHFGSPLQDFMDRMKGGLCHPRVARYREGLKYLQRKEHYHHLRGYHNRMVNKFLEMQKVWDDYPDADVDERLGIWKRWELERQLPQKPLDKKLPASKKQDVAKLVKVAARPLPGSRNGKGKLLSDSVQEIETGKSSENFASAQPRAVSRGILKLKIPVNAAELQCEPVPVYKPKGLLKVVQRGLPKGNVKEKGTLSQSKADIVRLDPDGTPAEVAVPIEEREEVVEVKKPRSKITGEKRKRAAIPAESKKRKKPHRSVSEENGESFKSLQAVAIFEEDRSLDQEQEVEVDIQADEADDDVEPQGRDFEELSGVDSPAKREAPMTEAKPEKRRPAKKGQGVGEIRKPRSKGPQEGFELGEKSKKGSVKKAGEKASKESKLLRRGKGIQLDELKYVQEDESFADVENLKDEETGDEEAFKSLNALPDPSKSKKKAPKRKKPAATTEKELAGGTDFVDMEEGRDLDVGEKVEDEMQLKALKRRASKKRAKADKDQTSAPDLSPTVGPSKEKTTPGSSTKSSKKPSIPVPPTLASTFSFSIIHLLSAVRVALLVPYQQEEVGPVSTEGEPKDGGGKQSFNLNAPPMMTADGQCLDQIDATQGAEAALNGYAEREPDSVDRGSDLMEMELDKKEAEPELPAIPFAEIVRRVEANPGDARMCGVDSMQNLVRGSIKVLSSRAAPQGVKGWKPLVGFDTKRRGWCWVGPSPGVGLTEQPREIPTSAEDWGISPKTLLKLEDMLAAWLKHGQEIQQLFVRWPIQPPAPVCAGVDEKERFKDFKAQKSLVTIPPTSEDMKAYFHREESMRYLLPDRPFSYTRSDGGKAVVAPLRRGGGKPTSKPRDHFMLKPDRPPHVTILCLVRDAAARLPASIGTRADVCALIRDSQYIMEEVSDAQVNQVVSGALDRLHYERDPCVRFDGDKKLWVYLHTDRDEEDFEDDGTSSTKRWKKPKKDGIENVDLGLNFETGSPCGGDIDTNGNSLGADVHSPDGLGEQGDPSSLYSDLVYNKRSSLTSPRVLGPALNASARDDMLPYMELPASIRPPPLNLPIQHMPWDSTFTSDHAWDANHLPPHENFYDEEAAQAAHAMFHVEID